ncbi:MAG: SusD/RagB family nutrient-binding outer membrane lipoprotein [Cyclobacteriaceae bacterium]|nr:SusD/RagB family nutrient-binding outer membrane lipoprotein [Cyclobacteriaceae bacterium]
MDLKKAKRKNTVAATKVLWALTFHRLTDFYGDVPYTEAALGTDRYSLRRNMIHSSLSIWICLPEVDGSHSRS